MSVRMLVKPQLSGMKYMGFSVEDYVKPDFERLTKVEWFDEDNARHLVSDERFNREDRRRLGNYMRHRTSGGKVVCTYRFGRGCEESKLGRLYPVDGLGLQSFRFDMRNPLTKKRYWDVDFVNAHYCIALRHCEVFGIYHDTIREYVMNRDECLKRISPNRKKAKTECLKVLYGGNIKTYKETYEEVEGPISEEGIAWLKRLEREVTVLATMVWDAYPEYHGLRTGSEMIAINKKSNPKYSLMSLIFQTCERDCLLVFDWYLRIRGRYMGVFIHDGGHVEKLEKETVFPVELCVEGTNVVNDIMGFKMSLAVKDIEYDWSPSSPQLTQYEVMKREFEQRNCLVGSLLHCTHADGKSEMIKIGDARIKFSNKIIEERDLETDKIKKRKFLDVWLEDPKRLEYERVGFYPDRAKCPPRVYNLFNGFQAEKYQFEMSWDEILEAVQPINKHLDFLTSGHSERMNKTLASLIQKPDMKTGVAMLIRDMGGLFVEGGGVGKNMQFEWFGNEILGEKYFIVVGDNRELFGTFNSLFEGKLLSLVEEANTRDNHQHFDMLKSLITSTKTNVNKKCVAQYEVADFNRFIFCSNNRNAFPVRQGSRRIEIFDSNPVMRGNVEYFTKYAKHLADDRVKYAYFTYLKSITAFETPIECQSTIPITDAFRDLRMMNAPMYHKWLVECVRNNTLENGYTGDLYNTFTRWVAQARDGNAGNMISVTAFGRLLMGAKEVQQNENDYTYDISNVCEKHKSDGRMMMTWNIPALVSQLKKIHLLEEEFVPVVGEE